MPVPARPSVNHPVDAPDQEREQTELVTACVESFEGSIGRDFHDRCNRFYQQYRGFRKFKDAWVKASPNDKDGLLYDAKNTWGAHLHIPLSYRTIETLVPRAVAHRPRLLYLPRHERWESNVQTVRLTIDAQQDAIDIDLPFQDVMRNGRIYGVGFGKCFWRRDYASRRRVKRRVFRPNEYVVGRRERELIFDDPMFEACDVFDVMWDPMGSSMAGSGRCRWVVHRTWMDLADCRSRIESGAWNTASAKALTEDKLRGMGSGQRYDEIWQERMAASGFGAFHLSDRGEQLHEVWEWHDGEQVLTVLDRQVLVQQAENPCVGHLPFQVYRPTPLHRQMVGIGDLEPIEHLQRELDTLRSQRRDAATLALAAGYVYDDAAIDEEDLQFGPFAAMRVTNANPREAVMPIQRQEVPGVAYQEEQVVKSDMGAIVGLTDDMEGPIQATTATEAQLVQASLSRRIELGSRRFEIEVVRNVARCFLRLNQRMILKERDPIRLPDEGMDVQQAAYEGRWQWFPVNPGSLRGEFEIVPEGGSMAARNQQADEQRAMQIMQLFGQNPYIEPGRPLKKALELFGVRDADSWLKQGDAPVPPAALEILTQALPEHLRPLVANAVRIAQANDPQLAHLAQEGPGVQQVDQMMQPQGVPA